MGLEGRKVSDNVVMFGEPIPEKALNALKARSPTAESILSSLPPSAYIPVEVKQKEPENTKAEEEQIQQLNSAKDRRANKKNKLKEKNRLKTEVKTLKENNEEIILNRIIEESKSETMDLEKELEALSEEATIRQPVHQQVEREIQSDNNDLKYQILDLLKNEENSPSEEMITVWKDRYGKSGIHLMAFGEGEVYIYHHLTRGEWKKLKALMAKLQQSENADEIEEKLKEKVVLHCILWPKVDDTWLDRCKAGVIDSLYQMILLNSGFLTPQQAMLLTTQL